jgi:WD40 repeat protein
MTGDDLRDRLRDVPVPGEADARERARAALSTAYSEREPMPARRSATRRALVVALPLLLALTVAALTPPGQAVGDWVKRAIRAEPERPKPAVLDLPARGRLLVSGARGAWIVQGDGARRRLGAYREATWSPTGRFVAATAGHDLVAVDPKGTVRWTITRPKAVADPRWAPSGFRVAYRAGRELRVVAGDGTGDRRLAERVRPVAPAWRPTRVSHVLAWVDRSGAVRVADVDKGKTIRRFRRGDSLGGGRTARGDISRGRRPAAESGPIAGPTAVDRIRSLSWSAGGGRLLAVSRNALRIFDLTRSPTRTVRARTGHAFLAAAFSPHGEARIAAIEYDRRADRSALRIVGRDGLLLSGRGRFTDLTWSPDGRWLLVARKDADQWLFVRANGAARVQNGPAVRRLFDPGRRARTAAFPRVEGWTAR